jgi:hypothetical protein
MPNINALPNTNPFPPSARARLFRWRGSVGKAGLKMGVLALVASFLAPLMDSAYTYEGAGAT